MIAEQVDRREVGQRLIDQQIDDLPALHAAIDVIADIDDQLVGAGRQLAGVFDDQAVQLGEKVGTAVHVADRIDADARRDAGRASGRGRP